jgi:hypothetical protein
MFKYVLSLLVCACFMASPAFAGGGKNATLRVINDLTAAVDPPYLVVIADPPASLIPKLNLGTATAKEIKAAGGVTIKKGSSASIPVKAGVVPVYATAILANGSLPPAINGNLTFVKGKTLTVKASEF